MKTSHLFLLAALAASFSPMVHGAVLYSATFDVDDTANWTVNNNGVGTNSANFFFDYSTVGIPSAPHSTGGSTKGLQLRANTGTTPAGSVLPALSVSPTGQAFSGDYLVTFDMWLNFQGVAGGSGSGNGTTQAGGAGVLTNGTSAQFAGVANSVHFSVTMDGGSAADYRAYAPGTTSGYLDTATTGGQPVFPAGSRNNSASYYNVFSSVAAPSAQTSLFSPAATTVSPVGTVAFAWHTGTISKVGNVVTFSIDGLTIARVDATGLAVDGSNILFNHYDTNNTASTDTLAPTLLFSLFDNIVVTSIPEPGTFALLGLAGLGLIRRRR